MPEVYIPGSAVPFRPLNPWGRAMPKPSRGKRADLYQIVVTRAGHGEIRFGPKMERQYVDAFFATIETAIRVGIEKHLSDPHIVKCV